MAVAFGGRAWGWNEMPPQTQVSFKHIMNCFQHTPESCGALHSPCGGAPQQRGPLTLQTQTRPNRLHTTTHPPKRLAHPRSPIPPLSQHTRTPLHPAALASVPYGIVLVRVRACGGHEGGLVATAARPANQEPQKIPLVIICCLRHSTAIQQPHTDNYSARPFDYSPIIGFSASYSFFSRDHPQRELPTVRLTSRACPR